MLELSIIAIVVCWTVVALGAMVQGTIGIGLGLVAAPILALVDRAFVPVGILVSVIPLTIAMAWREREHVDRRQVGIAVIGRVPGVALGAWAVATAGERLLAVLVAGSVLAAVAVSLTSFRFPTTDRSVFVAGGASGFMGTASGIGGPPMALTYQHADPSVMRATLSAFFTLGTLISIAGLSLSGAMTTRQLQLGLLLVPAVVVGYIVSRLVAGRLPADRIRVAVLVVCATSAIALLIDEFV